jgi:hypothetical protein
MERCPSAGDDQRVFKAISTNGETMSALPKLAFRAILLASALLLAAAAAGGPPRLAPYHQPPWLITGRTAVSLAYALLPRGATGTVYVRTDRQSRFTPLALRPGPYCPGDPADAAAMRKDKVCGRALVARVASRFTTGSRLYYYAIIRAGGQSVTVPSGGATRPQRVWVVRRFVDVRLGRHRFGQLRSPGAVVARATANRVGVTCCADPPGGDGPSSLDVAGDGSVWVLDRLNHRLLVWRRGVAGRPARTIRLPHNLSVSDFALGRDGRIYARAGDTADRSDGPKSHVYAFTATGRVRWRAPQPAGIPTAQLQIGADGRLYAALACGGNCAPFGGGDSWVPLTTAAGRPLSAADRARGATPFEPLHSGLRLVSEVSYTVARFALVDREGRVVHAWRVTSRTRLGAIRAAPALVGSTLVVPIDVSAGARWEQVILQLSERRGTSFSLAARTVLGENLVAPLRISADGRLYQLRAGQRTGASVAAYLLANR